MFRIFWFVAGGARKSCCQANPFSSQFSALSADPIETDLLAIVTRKEGLEPGEREKLAL